MPTQVTSYKCPSCGGPLHYEGHSGKLECEYCGSSFDTAEIEAFYAGQDQSAAAAQTQAEEKREQGGEDSWTTSAAGGDWGEDAENMRAYNCPSCGAELICDATTAATACPYCGNPSIVPGQFGGTLKPDYVIPFKLSREQAISALKSHYRHKKLLPKTFSDKNHIEEIKGVYVPFWLFDTRADAKGSYCATQTRIHKEGDYEVTETDYYGVRRAGTVDFTRIPVDGSGKMPDAHMDSIEPYDYGELKEFSTAYLPGFLADKYDVCADECGPRVDQRAISSAQAMLVDTIVGYDDVVATDESVSLSRGQVKYALMPVWMLSTKWNGESFLFAMNGQTGKLVGDLPVDKGRLLAWFVGIAAPVAAALSLIMLL